MQYIYSNQNAIFKYLKKLKTKKYRIIEGKIIIEGIRILKHAISLGIHPETIFYDSINMPDILRENERDVILENALFKQVSETVNSQGVVGIINTVDIQNGLSVSSENIVVVNAVQDSGNLGTIIRTADAFGFDNIILSKNTCDPYSQKSLRSSMGGIFSVNLRIGMKNEDIINFLHREGYKIVVSSLEAKADLKDITIDGKFAIVLGNEGRGVDKEFLEQADYLYKISMRESAESLNVGVATGITLHALSDLN